MNQRTHYSFDDHQVRLVLPHRPPMLLVDGVPDCAPTLDRLQAIKHISVSDPLLSCGMDDHAIFPCTLIIEALAQTCGLLMKLRWLEAQGVDIGAFAAGDDSIVAATSIPPSVLAETRTRQLRLVRAGDSLDMQVCITLQRGQMACFIATAANSTGICTELKVQLAFPEYTLRMATVKQQTIKENL